MSAATAIPFEKQTDVQTHRGCGAASLRMVYRSLGKEVAQDEIWPAISKANRFGSIASTTHLMAKDALSRGFAAIALQARHPLLLLRLCRDLGIRAILNHRLQPEVPTGHYSVLVDIDDKHVVLHDPFYGPSRELSPAALLELWQPRFSNSEIIGGVLIAISAKPDDPPPCQFCGTATPEGASCPSCKGVISLRPGAVLACLNQDCIACTWKYICCPKCDFMWGSDSRNASLAASGITPSSAAPGTDAAVSDAVAEPAGLAPMFEALDKFLEYVNRMPGTAQNPELQRQLQILSGSKASMKLALAEAASYAQIHKDQLAAFAQAATERAEAHRKRREELTKPSAPLDGNALGRALLKNLGFPTK